MYGAHVNKIDSTQQNMGYEKKQADSVPPSSASGDANIQPSSYSQQSAAYMPVTSYGYYYSGFIPPADHNGLSNNSGGSYAGGMQSGNGTQYYYNTGGYGYSSDYVQQPYGSEDFRYYSYDSTYAGNASSGNRNGSVKSNGFNAANTNVNSSNNGSAPFSLNAQYSASNFSRPTYHNYQSRPSNKPSSGYQGYQRPAGNYYRNTGVYMPHGTANFHSSGVRGFNANYKNRSRDNMGKNVENEAERELTRGPRAENKNDSPPVQPEVKKSLVTIVKEDYNLPEFKTEYDNAKFYVIKSYSEDDVHKSIKFSVWSSTENGNKKLEAAFAEATAKAKETGTLCPVFLFFSVNTSGQFVGVAEMTGRVDFSKNMNFWQVDKWNGFFPVKWHIIKDVPNSQFRQILLENNSNRPVTFCRDTQEVGLKQGLEMLSIFKNYSQKTSLLEDYNFYEEREKILRAKRASASVTNHLDAASLVSLTDNLSLDC